MQAELFATVDVAGLVAGVDEVGRGPLAGDVVTAAVILNPETKIAGLGDSKALSARQRDMLYEEIMSKSLCVHIARASVREIDQMNILKATMLAMVRAVDGLSLVPDHVLVDGNRLPAWSYSSSAIVKGDSKVAAISAASVLAKVTRDREMVEADRTYPGYGFAQHKGYGTKDHLAALAKLGPCAIHRRSFRPVKEALGLLEEK